MNHSLHRRWRRRTIAAVVLTVVVAALAMLYATAGFFDRDPIHLYEASGPRSPLGAVYFSGDMGLHYGMGPVTSKALAEHGIEVVGVSSPALFGTRRTRADVDRIVTDAVRQGLAQTRSRRVVLIGQSYGADILETGLANLPGDLRGRVAAVILVVPGRTVFFRADPSNIVYAGTPDSQGVTTARAITWAPLTCIHGQAETDSLCPLLTMKNTTIVTMPGGHFLGRDSDGLTAHVLAAIASAAPDAVPFPAKDRP